MAQNETLATSAPTVREAIRAYLEHLPPAMGANRARLIPVALAALLEPALDEPVADLNPLRLLLLGGMLKEKISPKTGRPLAAGTFRRYVLVGQVFYAWSAARWPRAAMPKARQEALATDEGE